MRGIVRCRFQTDRAVDVFMLVRLRTYTRISRDFFTDPEWDAVDGVASNEDFSRDDIMRARAALSDALTRRHERRRLLRKDPERQKHYPAQLKQGEDQLREVLSDFSYLLTVCHE